MPLKSVRLKIRAMQKYDYELRRWSSAVVFLSDVTMCVMSLCTEDM
jgi:hypothetical protein